MKYYFLDKSSTLCGVVRGMGNPVIAMLLSLLFALFTLSLRNGNKMSEVMKDLATWTVMETIIGVVGLAGVLLLNVFI